MVEITGPKDPKARTLEGEVSKLGGANKRIQHLERELARKEKALAEAAALMILRKKAEAIWGPEGGAEE